MDDRDLPFGRIGPYRLEARLGRGGMGEVFLARDERLGRRVAIKRVRWGPGIPASTLERLRREARATARLNHPAIVQVYDLIPDGEGDAMVMEYVLGRSLDTLVGDPSLTAAGAVRLAGEVAAGLAHAHSAGFVHRDLKGENVMVSGAGHAKILDFGLAKRVLPGIEDSLTVDGAVIGTYRSMSPEQAGGDEVDGRSDLFSLGVLLYEMLSGRTPFHAANPLATIKRVLTENPEPLANLRPDLPPGLLALIDRLLAKNREERPQSAEEVALSLAEMAELPGLGQGTLSHPDGPADGLTEPTLDLRHPGPHAFASSRAPAPELPASLLRPRALLPALLPLVALAATFFVLLKPIVPAPLAFSTDADKEYEAVKRLMEEGRTPPEAELKQLDDILQRSPHHIPALLAAAEVALSLYEPQHKASYLDEAGEHVRQVEIDAPEDNRALGAQFKLALARGRGAEAKKILDRFEDAMPGDALLPELKARLAESGNDLKKARAYWLAAVERDSSWMNLFYLAKLEARIGRHADARQHLRMLLERSRDNSWGLGTLADLELTYGDPEIAAGLYQKLLVLPAAPAALWTNLGVSRFLSGHYEQAIEAYNHNLEKDSLNPVLLLDWADAESALGRPEAQGHYYQALQRLRESKQPTGFAAEKRMFEAQCLAHLDQRREAVELAKSTVEGNPHQPGIAYQASLVYALSGRRTDALRSAREALNQGYSLSWFRIPAFDSLKSDPEFQSHLKAKSLP